MGLPTIGTVVLVSFPFADLKLYKKRPAIVVAVSSLDTVILCQVTSRQLPNVPAVALTEDDFSSGGLLAASFARPDKLFTVDSAMAKQALLGILTDKKTEQIRSSIRAVFN